MKRSRLSAVVLLLMFSPCVRSQTSSIRSIDFANFTYPSAPYLPDNTRKSTFTFHHGELTAERNKSGRITNWLVLGWVHYLDVTGDGVDDAVVDIVWHTGGSAQPDLIYIYTMRQDRPRLLWTFQTGDRADGGLKDIRSENGHLVLELYGKDKILGGNLYKDDGTHKGLCCPTMFTRTRYVWRGHRFRRVGNAERLRLET